MTNVFRRKKRVDNALLQTSDFTAGFGANLEKKLFRRKSFGSSLDPLSLLRCELLIEEETRMKSDKRGQIKHTSSR